ncbi:hypothetical protein [Aquisphaera insulae]|uniref:hypothetical protein n=1 Tax=Aquisphaera insulae TaxID=2712864 RepID=UPI0013ED6E1C|nr:hypothetical protein [Aquisphaera insulae]
MDRALRRFYARCAQVAILAMDNDGNLDLRSVGGQEDPKRPRHWLHAESGLHAECRWCQLHNSAENTRQALNWLPDKPGAAWPILIVVPVESIEAWLLITRAILQPGTGSLHAEREQRSSFKMRLYSRPAATLDDVRDIALPMIRQLNADQLQSLSDHSQSFANFAEQVERHRDEILTSPFCG